MNNIKKIIIMALVTLNISSCGEKIDEVQTSSKDNSSTVVVDIAESLYVNPLTGEKNLTAEQYKLRPSGVMVNNIRTAWDIQTGVNEADIIVECLVEGGITRYLALYKDRANMPQVGSIRSARKNFADIAYATDAIYLHCGADDLYCTPYMRTLGMDDIDINYADYAGERVDNGKSLEHTLYSSGAQLEDAIKILGTRSETTKVEPVLNFGPSGVSSEIMGGQACVQAEVFFSNTYSTKFDYNSESKSYTVSHGDEPQIDWVTKTPIEKKNIIILYDNYKMEADNYHISAEMAGGKGLYMSLGQIVGISWSRDAGQLFNLYDSAGNEMQINPGNSWLCIVPVENQSLTKLK